MTSAWLQSSPLQCHMLPRLSVTYHVLYCGHPGTYNAKNNHLHKSMQGLRQQECCNIRIQHLRPVAVSAGEMADAPEALLQTIPLKAVGNEENAYGLVRASWVPNTQNTAHMSNGHDSSLPDQVLMVCCHGAGQCFQTYSLTQVEHAPPEFVPAFIFQNLMFEIAKPRLNCHTDTACL